MSIRLRFTLLYNAILALTLAIFGVTLYTIQAQDSFNALKKDLVASSALFVQAMLRVPPNAPLQPQPGASDPVMPQRPVPFDEFSSDEAFRGTREREIVRVVSLDGGLVASPFGVGEESLPLSAEGLAVLSAGGIWWETAEVNGQPMLIYNRTVQPRPLGTTEARPAPQAALIVQLARPLTERDRSLNTLASTLVGASLVTLLAAFGIGWVLSSITLQPIQRMTQTAHAIGSERDFTRRVEYSGPQDEMGQLATTFNAMLTRLQEAYQRVADSLAMQRNFVADVSHELRTPLTTLRGNLELLGRTPALPDEEERDILDDMVAESDRLIRLVNDLLVLARADAGRKLDCEPIAAMPILEEISRQARQLSPDREIILLNEAAAQNQPAAKDALTDGTHPVLLGDRDGFKQVLLILLDNALKHSDGAVHISVRMEQPSSVEAAQGGGGTGEAEFVCIEVRDHGAGLAPDHLTHIFERFYRGENRGSAGFGLGLPIAKALVEGQGGQITFESSPGEGSTARIYLRTVIPSS